MGLGWSLGIIELEEESIGELPLSKAGALIPKEVPRGGFHWLLREQPLPSPPPWEAGCTWSRRKEGEEVRLQEFPGALFLAEILGMRRKEGGGANPTGNERRAPA